MDRDRSKIPSLTLAVAQSNPPSGGLADSVRQHLRLVVRAAGEGAEFIIFPELSLTGYSLSLTSAAALSADDNRLEPLRSAAREHGIVVVAGGPVLSPDGLHIGALIFYPDGRSGVYLKEYLHPGEEVAFVPGPGGESPALAGEVIGLAVCADITHPEHACAAAARGATVYAAGCFITEAGYEIDMDLLLRHTARHRMVVLMANSGGPTVDFSSAGKSAIWSDAGELLACAPSSGEALCLAERFPDGWRGREVIVDNEEEDVRESGRGGYGK